MFKFKKQAITRAITYVFGRATGMTPSFYSVRVVDEFEFHQFAFEARIDISREEYQADAVPASL